ncbi:MAG: alkaline phosphatase family protein [Gaiellales bacterium]
MRLLVLGLDGGDHALVRDLVAQGRMPTLARIARDGTFGPLASTIPAVTPTAWSTFLTGLNPGGHGIFNFASNPNRGTHRVESAASRSGTPFWHHLGAAGLRSAYVGIPFTYPPEPVAGVVVTGYGGPTDPAIVPDSAAASIRAAHPTYVTAHHPMKERWWEDFGGYAGKLLQHVDETGDICEQILELEPELSTLCVNFMSSDHAGHLGYHRLEPSHPAHDPAEAGDELIQVYARVDRTFGRLIDVAADLADEEPTIIALSDHGMKPIHWTFHANQWLQENGHLRYRARSLQGWKGGSLDVVSKVDQRLARTTRHYGRALDLLPGLPRPRPDRSFADVDYGSTRAYCFATGGQIFLGEASGARDDPVYVERLVDELSSIPHPDTGDPVFDVRRNEELYRGAHARKGPDLVILPRDERVHVESSRRDWDTPLELHDRLDPETFYGYSGHHGQTGFLAAAGPGVAPSELPGGAEIAQLAPTILALHGLASEGFDAEPLAGILSGGQRQAVEAQHSATPNADGTYTVEEEQEILRRLRDLGYE